MTWTRWAMGLVCAALSAAAAAGASAATVPPSGTIDLTTAADGRLGGAGAGDAFGWDVAPAGDVNGDGQGDLLVGAPRADANDRANSGSAYVVFGPLRALPTSLADPARVLRIDGAAAGDALGTGVSAAGDVDGDGLDDVAVGAPALDDSGRAGSGAAYVVFGRREGGVVDTAALGDGGLRFAGSRAGDQAGVSLANAGDLTGDGRPELVIGAPRADAGERENGGSAFVVFGGLARGTQLELGALGERGYRIDGATGAGAGLSVGAAPDMTGDGLAEILVGAPDERGGAGTAYVAFGQSGTEGVDLGALGDKGFAVAGAPGERLGVVVEPAGDVNGDGIPDIASGAPRANRRERPDGGSVYVVHGRRGGGVLAAGEAGSGFRIDGASAGDLAGTSVSAAGDLNGDGRGELVVAAPFADPLSRDAAGTAYVVYGRAEAADADLASLGERGFRLAGTTPHGWMREAAVLGDVDGDGFADLAIGSQNARASVPPPAPGGGDAPPAPAPEDPATGFVYLVLSPRTPPPRPPVEGETEELAAGCRAADNVELLIDDSGSMFDSDPQKLRRQAIELLLSKPRNEGEVLGAYEFGSDGSTLFAPQVVTPQGPVRLRRLLERRVQADDGGTDYNAAFEGVAQDNPAADARIFLTDGEHNEGEFRDLHRGGPPTYVIGLAIGRRGDAAGRLQRIATETGARYFPNVTDQRLQAVINQIDSRLNCDVETDAYVDTLEEPGDTDRVSTALEDAAESADLDISWDDAGDQVIPGDLELLDDDGDVVARARSATLRRALARPGRIVRTGGLSIRGRKDPTFVALRVSGLRGERLRLGVRARRVRGRPALVTTQVSQSRRSR